MYASLVLVVVDRSCECCQRVDRVAERSDVDVSRHESVRVSRVDCTLATDSLSSNVGAAAPSDVVDDDAVVNE